MIKYSHRDVVQLVERTVRDREVVSSSLTVPTQFFFCEVDSFDQRSINLWLTSLTIPTRFPP